MKAAAGRTAGAGGGLQTARDADARKRWALGLGAQAYCFEFDTLYREIDRILAPGSKTGQDGSRGARGENESKDRM